MIFFSGESVPVMKSALPMSDFDENDHQDNYDTERHKRHTLFSGELTNSYLILMSGSCHLDKASNVEIGVECQIFLIASDLTPWTLTLQITLRPCNVII